MFSTISSMDFLQKFFEYCFTNFSNDSFKKSTDKKFLKKFLQGFLKKVFREFSSTPFNGFLQKFLHRFVQIFLQTENFPSISSEIIPAIPSKNLKFGIPSKHQKHIRKTCLFQKKPFGDSFMNSSFSAYNSTSDSFENSSKQHFSSSGSLRKSEIQKLLQGFL